MPSCRSVRSLRPDCAVDVVAPVLEHLPAQADRELQHLPVVLRRARTEHGRAGEEPERHARVGAGLREHAQVRRQVRIARRHQQDAGVRGRQLPRRAVIGIHRLRVRLGRRRETSNWPRRNSDVRSSGNCSAVVGAVL